jgi:hypothetical protein
MNGYNTHRHENNPKEKEFHDKFNSDFMSAKYDINTIDRLIFGHYDYLYPNDYLNDREKKIILSAIQWLGSPIGQTFLNTCGFEKINLKE